MSGKLYKSKQKQGTSKPVRAKRAALNKVAITHKPNDIEAKPVMGRPLTYDIEIGRAICDRVAMGETITSICKEPDQPNLQTFYNWMNRPEGKELLECYAQAKERCAEALFFEQVDIAKASTKETIGPARLQADVLDRVAARLAPTKYSERYLSVSNGSDNRANVLQIVFMQPETRPDPVTIDHDGQTDDVSDGPDDKGK